MDDASEFKSIYIASPTFPAVAFALALLQLIWPSVPLRDLIRGLVFVCVLLGLVFGISALLLSGGKRGWVGIVLSLVALGWAVYLRNKYHWA
jgi:hypothetical protein